MNDPRALLALQIATGTVLSPEGRMLRVNSADTFAPPRMYLSGCSTGWIVRLRHDVEAQAAEAIEELAAREPPVSAPGATPRFAERYREILGVSAPLSDHDFGPIHRLPNGSASPRQGAIVSSGTADGNALLARLTQHGVPANLIDVGFAGLSDFWEPWCAALEDGEIAAIAFAARLGPFGADIGVTTMEPFRGRGFASAATAAWSAHPALRERTLFYSTHRDNLSSRRVIARLGLPFLGESMRL
jgi:hypothetical protein